MKREVAGLKKYITNTPLRFIKKQCTNSIQILWIVHKGEHLNKSETDGDYKNTIKPQGDSNCEMNHFFTYEAKLLIHFQEKISLGTIELNYNFSSINLSSTTRIKKKWCKIHCCPILMHIVVNTHEHVFSLHGPLLEISLSYISK